MIIGLEVQFLVFLRVVVLDRFYRILLLHNAAPFRFTIKAMGALLLRQEVLRLYKQVLRLSKTWESALGNPGATEAERQYIADEARYLFTKNKHVSASLQMIVSTCN